MLHTDAAQQRPGNLPSAPQASQKPLRAQNQTNERTTSQLRQSQPSDTTAAERPAGTMGTTYTSLIPGGPPSPSPWNSTPHDACRHYRKLHPPKLENHNMGAEPSMHNSIPPRKETSKPAATACSWEANPRPLQPRPNTLCSRQNPSLRLRSGPSTCPGLHETLPSGRDTSRPSMRWAKCPPTTSKQIRTIAKCSRNAQTFKSLQLSQDHGGNALIRLKRLAWNAPHLPLEDGYE